jgi:hypothetical protein
LKLAELSCERPALTSVSLISPVRIGKPPPAQVDGLPPKMGSFALHPGRRSMPNYFGQLPAASLFELSRRARYAVRHTSGFNCA